MEHDTGRAASERPAERPSHGGAPRVRPAIGKVGRGLPSVRCAGLPPPEVIRGFEQFNLGEFFEQHETLEDAWIAETDPVRYLYQGILQVGVGLYHLGRGNLYGAERLIARGLALLESFRPSCMGVDVDRFIAQSSRCLEVVKTLTPETIDSFDPSIIPQIAYRVG